MTALPYLEVDRLQRLPDRNAKVDPFAFQPQAPGMRQRRIDEIGDEPRHLVELTADDHARVPSLDVLQRFDVEHSHGTANGAETIAELVCDLRDGRAYAGVGLFTPVLGDTDSVLVCGVDIMSDEHSSSGGRPAVCGQRVCGTVERAPARIRTIFVANGVSTINVK
jgi:hypothetical protein